MMLTAAEKRLLNIYYSGSAEDTAAVVRDALADITEQDERTAAVSLLLKLEAMGTAEFEGYDAGNGALL